MAGDWSRIEELFHAALERAPDERVLFLREACGADDELRREVESLLAEEPCAERMLQLPAASALTHPLALVRGTQLGPYEVGDLLGAGGMGEVYRARDTRLDRDVAVKVLPADFACDPERLRRFEREAKAVAALNHPHILTVHDVGALDGIRYVVTELLEGETLRERLERRPPTLKEALSLAVQAASGLAAAHKKGVVHRDVKPENLFLTSGGAVKILDFGLAKQHARASKGEPGRTASDVTREGVVIGTAAYMSPEQAQGLAVDARSDVFSFGVVLYELLTRKHPFRRETPAATVAAVMESEPKPPGQFSPGLPPGLEKLVLRCLRKDPEKRFQSMTDVELELEDAAGELDATRAARPRRRRVWAVAAAAFLALVGVAAGLGLRSTGRTLPPPRVVQLTSFPGTEVRPALSPDGRQVAFASDGEKSDNFDIYVQMVDGGPPLRLTTDPATDSFPTWSPDGRELAFLRAARAGAAVYVVSALGGPERKVADLGWTASADPSLAWTPDGKALVAVDNDAREGEGIYLVPLAAGERRRLTPRPKFADAAPRLSPDGRLLAYLACTERYDCELQVLPLGRGFVPEGPPRGLGQPNTLAYGLTWSSDGRSLIYAAPAGGMTNIYLWRLPLTGSRTPERIDLAGELAGEPNVARGHDRLVFTRARGDTDIWRVTEGGGPPEPFIASSRFENQPTFSPDGKRLAFCSNRWSDSIEIFVSGADGTGAMQLTRAPGRERCSPSWSPDSRRIAFDSQADDGSWDVYVVDAAGGAPRLLTPSPANEAVPTWSRDGRWIYFASTRTGRHEIWRAPAEGGDAVPVTHTGGFYGEESFDGRTLYYVKNEVSPQPVFARPVSGGEERQVLDSVYSFKSYRVVEDGLYYWTPRGKPRPGHVLRFLDLRSGKTRDLARSDGPLHLGLTVSPDRKTILFAPRKAANVDLVLIENFR